LLADSGYDLVPAETVDPEEIRYCVEGGGGSFCEVDVFEGLEIEFADGFRFEDYGGWARGLEGWWGLEDSCGDGVFGAGAEEDDSCPSCAGLVRL
jgi:hypothetical protein